LDTYVYAIIFGITPDTTILGACTGWSNMSRSDFRHVAIELTGMGDAPCVQQIFLGDQCLLLSNDRGCLCMFMPWLSKLVSVVDSEMG
jgi:hypothetical protein